MTIYNVWHDIIDQINECEFIISSSLHGLIISDAYNIPNVWAVFSDKIVGGEFKYKDYYASVNKKPISIKPPLSMKQFDHYVRLWQPNNINIQEMLSVCPFASN